MPRLKSAIVLLLLACLTLLLVKTLSWPLISDAVLIHYIVLLMHHGLAPYRQIVDVNMPGSYLADLAVTRFFGPTALGWRLYDYALTALAAFAIVTILGPRNRFAGVLAAALFALGHIADGPAQSGQRDYLVAVLLLAGFAALLRGLEKPRYSHTKTALPTPAAWPFFLVGLACGAAASIKPPALVFALLPAAAIWLVRSAPSENSAHPSHRDSTLRLAAATLTGLLVPAGGAAAWLLHWQAMPAFLDATRGLILYHAGMARHSYGFLLSHAVPSPLLPVVILAAILMVCSRNWRRPDQFLALLALACGLACFCAQGKAYPYHRYPLLGFLWVLVSMQFAAALSQTPETSPTRLRSALTWATIAYCTLWLAPASTARTLRYDWRYQPTLVQLQADLTQLGPLDGHVQCMDTMAGCITVLDRMQLLQTTGFLYDCYFFAPGASPVQDAQRHQFLAAIERTPPRVFILTDQWCLNLPSGYQKLAQWPEFAAYLNAHYSLARQRVWPAWDATRNRRYTATYPFGYRIYLHR